MYEWHGWATLRKHPASTDDFDGSDVFTEEDVSLARALLADSESTSNETADLRAANGQWHVWLAGFHNHHDPDIAELFSKIALTLPGSYGVLYTYDDEASDGWDRWVMRRGNVCHVPDEDLSPHIGVVEDPWTPLAPE